MTFFLHLFCVIRCDLLVATGDYMWQYLEHSGNWSQLFYVVYFYLHTFMGLWQSCLQQLCCQWVDRVACSDCAVSELRVACSEPWWYQVDRTDDSWPGWAWVKGNNYSELHWQQMSALKHCIRPCLTDLHSFKLIFV